jgi:hypothetical protein
LALLRRNKTSISILAQGFTLSEFLTQFVIALSNNPEKSVIQFYREFEQRLGLEYQAGRNVVFTAGVMLALLYLLIVFPKEKFRLKNEDVLVKQLDNAWGKITVETANSDSITLKDLVRRLRNSISHARIHFSDDGFLFEDSRPNQQPDIRIYISLESLNLFTTQLAKNLDFALLNENQG